jgi:hypothetical protein
MTSVSELDAYEIAYLCGGAERVAVAAVVAMQQDGRIAISRTRHRVQVARRRASQPVERAVLDAVPDAGTVLGQLLNDVAHSAAVREMIDGLRRNGLVGHHSLAGRPHLSAAGRKARAELEDSGVKVSRERRVAVLGTSGIADTDRGTSLRHPTRRRAASCCPRLARPRAPTKTSLPTRTCRCNRGYRAAGDPVARQEPTGWPMPKMTPEQEARYALDWDVARSGLSPDAQLAYDLLAEERAPR